MLKAKNVQSNNMLDVDSNLNIIYQLLDGLRQSITPTLTLYSNTSQTLGYNSEYVTITFENASVNFENNALSYDSEHSAINVNPEVFSSYDIDGTIELRSEGEDPTKTIYMTFVEVLEDDSEVRHTPIFREPLGYRSQNQRLLSFHFNIAPEARCKQIKINITTNDTVALSKVFASVSVKGITRNMS